jgi:hypothetical protein
LESIQEVPFDQRTFIAVLGRLYRDCQRARVSRITIEEFADLASMARKVRWKNLCGPGFGIRFISKLKRKLSYLRWNPSTARFETDLSLTLKTVVPRELKPRKPWKELSRKAKTRLGAKIRRWKKEHKQERFAEQVERDDRVSGMIREAIK